ncbi:MAG: SET domain-containing protein-lysine N-methyltransferase [Legionellaceae bacterium]|nr:SET domain-containing protein-lysine N-methyltransferase [Legionellaceae bacterium]
MVNITLTNHTPDTSLKHVTIDVLTGLVTRSDGRQLNNIHDLGHEPFMHPLLLEPYTPKPNHHFEYIYDDLNGLFYSAIFVYSVLINTDAPLACQFTIKPSAQFKQSRVIDNLHFSLNYRKASNSTITVEELNRFTSKHLGLPFFFSDDLIIHENNITLDKLPIKIDGDRLYETTPEAIQALSSSIDLTCCELRYIDPIIGFGVFARTLIKKNTPFSIYAGLKVLKPTKSFIFLYEKDLDILNLSTDAEQQGNLTRFINHAPTTVNNKNHMIANTKNKRHCLNGIEFIAFVTTKDILPGEQIFTDYYLPYFGGIEPIYFNNHGRVIHTKFNKNSRRDKLEHIRSMASEGFQIAQRYVWMRCLAILGVIVSAVALIQNV